jgi:hypothetical protein
MPTGINDMINITGRHWSFRCLAVAILLVAAGRQCRATEIHIGGESVSITPDQPVALAGQMHARIAKTVESEVTATALALESRDGDRVLDQAILVSCDLVGIREGVLQKTRELVRRRLPDFDATKLLINATHTHTAPVMREGIYTLPKDGIMQPTEYVTFLTDRIAQAAVAAWKSRRPGGVGWGLGHAVVAQNRRSVYADGRSVMYGRTNAKDFRGFEGYEDHGVDVLFFWDDENQLTATAINVACPSQEVESRSEVSADFWHTVRQSLKAKHGQDLLILGWTGAAGDQSPHLMYQKRAEERMRELRGLTRLEELSQRIVAAWEEALAGAEQEIHADAKLVHLVQTVQLPLRKVTDEELAVAQAKVDEAKKDPAKQWRARWEQAVVDRYERQLDGHARPYSMELHALRIGDVAVATNDFELFTDFGIQMKARSPALQTFLIQLCGPGTYVPTTQAVRGGGYSAIVESSEVGPEGGQVLTDHTVQALKKLWPDE